MSDTSNLAVDDAALVAPATARLVGLSTVDAFMKLSPLQRFQELIAGPSFHEYLRAEPIKFHGRDPDYGYLCDIPGCELSTAGKVYCLSHQNERLGAENNGIPEPEWRQQARPRNLPAHFDTSRTGIVSLAGLPPLAAAELRYAIFANATSPRPTKWNPKWLRALIEGLEEKGVASIMEIDTARRAPGTGRKKNLKHLL